MNVKSAPVIILSVTLLEQLQLITSFFAESSLPLGFSEEAWSPTSRTDLSALGLFDRLDRLFKGTEDHIH
jgi:hypothetical protein